MKEIGADDLAEVQLPAMIQRELSRRTSRRRRLAVLLTYGSAAGSSAASKNTAGPAGTDANTSVSRVGENSMRSASTSSFY